MIVGWVSVNYVRYPHVNALARHMKISQANYGRITAPNTNTHSEEISKVSIKVCLKCHKKMYGCLPGKEIGSDVILFWIHNSFVSGQGWYLLFVTCISELYCNCIDYVLMLFAESVLFQLKTFKATFYSSLQLINFVNDEQKVALKVFKRVKGLWVLKCYKNNAFLAVVSNVIIFDKFQPMCV